MTEQVRTEDRVGMQGTQPRRAGKPSGNMGLNRLACSRRSPALHARGETASPRTSCKLLLPQRSMLLLLLLSRFSRVRLCATPQMAATRLLRPWDSPGKNTGVGCHVLLQCMKVKSESEVARSCPTLSDPMDCSLSGSSTHGIFQARILEWVTIALFLK